MTKVIVVIGPTSVGKTKLGIALAKRLDGEIISGDSMQIYKDMDIGTAKVTAKEMDGVPHYCLNIKDVTEEYSVKEFQDTVRFYIDEISQRGKQPIIVGGTGLYIKAALYDYVFQEEKTDRESFREKYKDFTDQQLFDHLMSIDKKSADVLHPHNRQRVLRAIEIYEETGQRKSEIIDLQKHESLYDTYFIGLTMPRPQLYQRIDERIDEMRQQGLEKEVADLYQKGLRRTHQSMKAIGYKEWFDYFEGHMDKERVYKNIKTHSRQYAKRQYTWFKNQFEVHWYEVNQDDFDQTIECVLKDIYH